MKTTLSSLSAFSGALKLGSSLGQYSALSLTPSTTLMLVCFSQVSFEHFVFLLSRLQHVHEVWTTYLEHWGSHHALCLECCKAVKGARIFFLASSKQKPHYPFYSSCESPARRKWNDFFLWSQSKLLATMDSGISTVCSGSIRHYPVSTWKKTPFPSSWEQLHVTKVLQFHPDLEILIFLLFLIYS